MSEKNVTIKCEEESDKTDIISPTLTDRVKKRALKLKKEKEMDDMIKKTNPEMKNRQQEKDNMPAKVQNRRISKPKNEKKNSDLKKSGNSEETNQSLNQKQQKEDMPPNKSAREKRILKLKNEKKLTDLKKSDNSETKVEKQQKEKSVNSNENKNHKKNRNEGRNRKKTSPKKEKIKVFFGNKFPD